MLKCRISFITKKIDSILPTESADFQRFVPIKVVHPDQNWKLSSFLNTPLYQLHYDLVKDGPRNTALSSYKEVHLGPLWTIMIWATSPEAQIVTLDVTCSLALAPRLFRVPFRPFSVRTFWCETPPTTFVSS